jgi:glycosyl transferase family 25
MIKAFVITAEHETSRRANVRLLKSQLPGLEEIEAIYPTRERVPFISQLIAASKERTGTALNPGEIGVLLSNRKIWRKITHIASDNSETFLILESDSQLLDVDLLHRHYHELAGSHDLFFFGAWSGHARLLRSTKKRLKGRYTTGTAFIKTIYGAYGYSINKKAAAHLLKQTARISHPVDQYKYYIRNNEITIGSVVPEIISHHSDDTLIGHPAMHPLRKKMFFLLLDIKNTIVCFFK